MKAARLVGALVLVAALAACGDEGNPLSEDVRCLTEVLARERKNQATVVDRVDQVERLMRRVEEKPKDADARDELERAIRKLSRSADWLEVDHGCAYG